MSELPAAAAAAADQPSRAVAAPAFSDAPRPRAATRDAVAAGGAAGGGGGGGALPVKYSDCCRASAALQRDTDRVRVESPLNPRGPDFQLALAEFHSVGRLATSSSDSNA